MDKKIKLLVVPSDKFGVGLFRSVSPHVMIDKLFRDEFDVEISYEVNWSDFEYLSQFDIIHVHKGVYQNMEPFTNAMKFCKDNNIVFVIDVDDYWMLTTSHPMFNQNKAFGASEKTVKNLQMADYVTTTTDIFAKKIATINKNVVVFPNAIDDEEEQYLPIKNPSNKIRFGFVMGSSHEKDMELVEGIAAQLPKDILDKIQFVLCGFDTRGSMSTFDEQGKLVNVRPIKPEETVWYRYEKNVTNNYKIVSDQYKMFLERFMTNAQWPNVENEAYRREWTKDVSEYATHYRNIDVLLAPICESDFNKMKSELKLIEAGFTNTAVIASDFGPYKIGTKNLIKFGGEIDPDGNCILIENKRARKDWAKMIKKLVQNPDLIETLRTNLRKDVVGKYNLKKVATDRANWYKSIVKK